MAKRPTIKSRSGQSETRETVTKPEPIGKSGDETKVDNTRNETAPKAKPVKRGVGGSFVINENGERVKA